MWQLLGYGASEDAHSAGTIDVYDQFAVKRRLDDAVAEYVDAHGAEEEYTWPNVRLGIMAVACLVGLGTQFFPGPFPDNRVFLMIGVVLYFGLSTGLQLLSYWVDNNIVIFVKESADVRLPRFWIALEMDHYDPMVRIIAEWGPGGKGYRAMVHQSYGGYFTKSIPPLEEFVGVFPMQDGRFSRSLFWKDLDELVAQIPRRGSIPGPSGTRSVQTDAAVRIQAAARGHLSRRPQ